MDRETAKIVAKALFYASLQASIGSVEMSSKFSVKNFSKDQRTLDAASEALKGYMVVGTVWTSAAMLALYASHGCFGAVVGLLANLLFMAWIYWSYVKAFKEAAAEYKLNLPVTMTSFDWVVAGVVIAIVGGGMYCLSPQGWE